MLESIFELTFTMLFVFYPVSAVLTIFCNILLDPLKREAEEDLQLLFESANLIQRLRTGCFPLWRRTNLTHLEDLVVELAKVAQIAITEVANLR
jgi:hypothetical protein